MLDAFAAEIGSSLGSLGGDAAAIFAVSCAQRVSSSLQLREYQIGPVPEYRYIYDAIATMWHALDSGDAEALGRIAPERLESAINYDDPISPLSAELAGKAIEVTWFAHAMLASDDASYVQSAARSASAIADAAAMAVLGHSQSASIDEEYERLVGETKVVRFEVAEQRRGLEACRLSDSSVVVNERRHAMEASLVLRSLLAEAVHTQPQQR